MKAKSIVAMSFFMFTPVVSGQSTPNGGSILPFPPTHTIATSAFGKWHNTPATATTSIDPKDRWPTGFGFDHFYGFLACETSQWEPRLVKSYVQIEPPHDESYYLTEDMIDQVLGWLDDRQTHSPDKPFLMHWAPGAVHVFFLNGPTRTKEGSTTAGMRTAREFISVSLKWALFRGEPSRLTA